MIAGKLPLPFGKGAVLQACSSSILGGHRVPQLIHPISQISFYILFLKEKNKYAGWNR